MTDLAQVRPRGRGVPRRGSSARADFATLGGLAGGFALVAGAILMGGALTAFVDLPSIAIVVGGTLAASIAAVGAGGLLALPRAIGAALTRRRQDPLGAAYRVVALADLAKRRGVLALQAELDRPSDPTYLSAGLGCLVDGANAAEAERMMAAESHAVATQSMALIDTLRRAAEAAPAMGLVGTLVGLVQMLARLDDPSSIGPALAVALLTTLYGALLGYLVFAPLAAKLERDSGDELLVQDILRAGVTAIARGEHPRRLESLIVALLPPALRGGPIG